MIDPEEMTRRERIKIGLLGMLGGLIFVACFAYAGAYLRWADAQITALRQLTGL